MDRFGFSIYRFDAYDERSPLDHIADDQVTRNG